MGLEDFVTNLVCMLFGGINVIGCKVKNKLGKEQMHFFSS